MQFQLNSIHQQQKALQLKPGLERLEYLLGVLYSKTDQPTKAIHTLEQLITKNPRLGPAHKLLAYLNFQAGQFRQAWRHLKTAESLGESIDQAFRSALETKISIQ